MLTMVGKEEATLRAPINPQNGETWKLKGAWKWRPDTQIGAVYSFHKFNDWKSLYIERRDYLRSTMWCVISYFPINELKLFEASHSHREELWNKKNCDNL